LAVPVAALVFDFDGLMVDTESAEYEAIRRVYADHGAHLALEAWLPVVGAAVAPDWVADLEGSVGEPLDRAALLAARQAYSAAVLADAPLLPGVATLLDAAHRAGISCGVASNSSLDWVARHLDRIGLSGRFEVIVTIEQVERGKPAPEPYLVAVAALGADPRHAVAFEDSEIGVAAATAAGLYTVAVPGPMSRRHDVSAADMVVASLDEVTLDRLAAGLSRRAASYDRRP
jgi:HAD superfamily hydrolase (TIGR01509 family)